MSMTSAGSLRPAGYWITIAIPFHLLRPLHIRPYRDGFAEAATSYDPDGVSVTVEPTTMFDFLIDGFLHIEHTTATSSANW